MTRVSTGALGASLVCLCPCAAGAQGVGLATFVEEVLAGSPDARLADAEVAAAGAETAAAGLRPNPALDFQRQGAAGTDPSQDLLVASIPLVLSGRLGHERESARLSGDAAAARRERARARLVYEAVGAFLALAGLKEREEALRASLPPLERLSQRAAAREKAGEAAGYDRLRVELEQASVRDALDALEAEGRRAGADALRLLGPSVTELPALDLALPPAALDARAAELLAAIEGVRADLRALGLEARADEAAARAARARRIPEPQFGAGVVTTGVPGSGSGAGYAVTLSVPLPVFDAGGAAAAAAGARAQVAQARRAALLHEARARAAALLAEARGVEERLRRHRERVLAPAEALRAAAEAAWAGGEAELLVLLDAERSVREARETAALLAGRVRALDNELRFVAGAYDVPTRSRMP